MKVKKDERPVQVCTSKSTYVKVKQKMAVYDLTFKDIVNTAFEDFLKNPQFYIRKKD